MSTGVKSLSTLTVALVIFGLAGSAVMVAVPGLFAGPVRPEFTVFLLTGVAAIVLTAGFFGYIYRLGMGFGRTVLVLAAGYNALIAAVKLGLAPAALYQANREQAFDAAFGDPNELWFYLGVGSGVLLLYLLVFGVMYSIFKRRFRRRSLPSEPPPEQRGRWSNRTIVVGVVVLVAFAASFLWIMPVVYVGLPTFSYLLYIFTTFGAAIALALVLAAVLAYKSFDEVEKRAVRLGHAARPSMPQDAGFVDAQRRHSAIGQLHLYKATFGKRQRTYGLGWKGEMTSEACVYDDLNVGAVALGARTHDLE